MKQHKDAIKQAIVNQYGGEKDNGSVVNVDVDIEINGENDGSRHSIYLVNKCSKPDLAGEAEEGGKYMNTNMNEVDVKEPSSILSKESSNLLQGNKQLIKGHLFKINTVFNGKPQEFHIDVRDVKMVFLSHDRTCDTLDYYIIKHKMKYLE